MRDAKPGAAPAAETLPDASPAWELPTAPARLLTAILLVAAIGTTCGLLVVDLPREADGGLALILMLLLIALRVPVGIAMILAGSLGIFSVAGWASMANSFETVPFRSVASWPLSVLPMFILMGILLYRSGATSRVYDAARVWINWLPGGLAVTTNAAGAGLAAVSGSTLGITYALGRLSIPEMIRSGYDSRLSVGAVLMAGTGGQLLPPSILMVIYAGVAGTPVGQQLLAGVGPGLVLPLGFGLMIVAISVARPNFAPKEHQERIAFSTRLRLTLGVWPIVALMAVVVGGIFSGVFTATEAGAYGAFLAVLLAFGFQGLRDGATSIRLALVETATATAAILLLIVGAGFITRMLTLSGLSQVFVSSMEALPLSRIEFLLMLVLVYLILGMFLDPMTMVILTVPLLIPALVALEISLLWFGAFIVLLGELSIVTPPVGMLSFVVHKIVQDPEVSQGRSISLGQVFQAVGWFLPIAVAVLLLLIFVPEVATWLPELSDAS